MSEPEDDEDIDLLTSPLQNTGVGKLFIVGGPIGLAIAISLSLWASWMHVRHSVVVQVEPEWVPGERLALRSRLASETMEKVAGLGARAWVEQGGQRFDLPPPRVAGAPDLVQTAFDVPTLDPGQARLFVELTHADEPRIESVDVEVVPQRNARRGAYTVSSSTLQHGDDSDPQLEPVRIDILPDGGVHSEFDNTFYVRVLHPDGKPYPAEVEVLLAYGELGKKKGDTEAPVRLKKTRTDRLGLLSVSGRLTSEVIRLEARVLSEAGEVRFKRRMRFVSYAGAVEVNVSHRWTPPAATLGVEAHGITARRPVFVDVHDANGAWIDALAPFDGLEEPREWSHPGLPVGVLQFEAYHFTNDPGESTALRRVQVGARPEDLDALILAQRARATADHDRAYLDWLAGAQLSAAEVDTARAFLLGTLPVEIHGPPLALDTHERDLQAMAVRQHKWTVGLRWFMLGGGALFLAAMTFAMIRSHAQAARSTMAELARLNEGKARAEAALAVERAKRQALVRGLGVIGVMAAALVLTTILLESLLWVF